MALSKSLRDELSGRGKIRARAKLPEINAYIKRKNGGPRALVPTEVQILNQEASAQLRVLMMNWPVATGTSRAGWAFYVSGRMGAVEIVFENPVYYSGWIVRKGSKAVASGGEPWFHELMPQVWKAGKPRLVRRLRDQIDKTQKEIEALKAQGNSQRRAEQLAGQGKMPNPAAILEEAQRKATQTQRLGQVLSRFS